LTTDKAPANLADETQQAIEAVGGRIVPLAEFFDLNEVQMRVIELEIRVAEAIRRLRTENGLTQAALAKRLGVARPRIAEIEGHKKHVSLDALIPAFFAAGGTSRELSEIISATDSCMQV